MDSKITKKQLKEALSVDVDRLLDDVVEAMNKAKPGKYYRRQRRTCPGCGGTISPHVV